MINTHNIYKYIILFSVVTLSTYMIPNCNIINLHAMYIGLLTSTTFIILDKVFPHTVIVNENEKKYY